MCTLWARAYGRQEVLRPVRARVMRASWGVTPVRVDCGSGAFTGSTAALREQVNEKAPYLYGLVEFQSQRPARVRC
jgi:hypothetical protein